MSDRTPVDSTTKPSRTEKVDWFLGSHHPTYGECVGVARFSGEQYRWFEKDRVVTMIPLWMLQDDDPPSIQSENGHIHDSPGHVLCGTT